MAENAWTGFGWTITRHRRPDSNLCYYWVSHGDELTLMCKARSWRSAVEYVAARIAYRLYGRGASPSAEADIRREILRERYW